MGAQERGNSRRMLPEATIWCECGQSIRVEGQVLGSKATCTTCGRVFVITPAETEYSLLGEGSSSSIHSLVWPEGLEWAGELENGRYRFCHSRDAHIVLATDQDGAMVVIKHQWFAGPDWGPTYDDTEEEIRLHSQLRHANLAEFVAGYPEERVLVTKWVPGIPLGRYYFLAPCRAAEAVKRLTEVADAASYLHRKGIIHRDITPENVVCTRESTVLIDLGAAVQCAPGPMTRVVEKTMVGSPSYSLYGLGRPTRSSVLSLTCSIWGALGFMMLRGHLAWSFSYIIEELGCIDPHLLAILERADSSRKGQAFPYSQGDAL